eukprot:1620475-Prymnesium_polylepis.1
MPQPSRLPAVAVVTWSRLRAYLLALTATAVAAVVFRALRRARTPPGGLAAPRRSPAEERRQKLQQPDEAAPRRYVALYKPCFCLCSMEDDGGRAARKGREQRETLADLGLPAGLHNVGRLDRDSEGLLLLTDDGAFTHEVLQGGHPKRYWAQVRGAPTAEALATMARGGLRIPNHNGVRESKPADLVRVLPPGQLEAADLPVAVPGCAGVTEAVEATAAAGDYTLPAAVAASGRARHCTTWLEVVLREGLNRQVKRLTKHAGHATLRLVRMGVAELTLESLRLKPGEWVYVRPEDVLPPSGGGVGVSGT